MPERKGGLIAKGEANGVCCSDWAGQADSQIFNPDDLHSFHDGHASRDDGDIYAALGGPSEEEMIVGMG
jgi:hypothetical protein